MLFHWSTLVFPDRLQLQGLRISASKKHSVGKDWFLSEGKHHLIFMWDCAKVTSLICLAAFILQRQMPDYIPSKIKSTVDVTFISRFASMPKIRTKLRLFCHCIKLKCFFSVKLLPTAHRCSEPKESSFLFGQIWDLGGWPGAQVPLRNPLFHLQLHPHVASAHRKCVWKEIM